MQELATIARPYARAAFEQAREEKALKAWSGALQLLAAAVSDPLMRKIIGDPRISDEQLYEIVVAVYEKKPAGTISNFLKLLVSSGRLGAAVQIAAQFEQKRAGAEGISEVSVVTAYELGKAQREAIASIMKKKLGKDVQLFEEVDKSIIGGVVIRAGDSVIDASLRGRLRQLGNQLAK